MSALSNTVKLTVVFGECEHYGDLEDYLGFIANPARSSLAEEGRQYGPGVPFCTLLSAAGVGYEQGVAMVSLRASDAVTFRALAEACGFMESCREGDLFDDTVAELDYDAERDEEDADDDEDGDY